MNTNVFRNVLKLLKTGVKASAGGQVDCVVFDDGRMYTNNGESAVIVQGGFTGITGAIEHKLLSSFFAKLEDETFEFEQKDNKLTVRYGGSNVVTFNLQPIKLNITQLLPVNAEWQELPSDFNLGLDNVLFCAAKSTELKQLSYVQVNNDNLVATNGLLAGVYSLDGTMSTNVDTFCSFYIPYAIVKDLINLNPVLYFSNGSRIFFKNDKDDVIIINHHDYIGYPPILNLFKTPVSDNEVLFRLDTKTTKLCAAIERLGTIVESESIFERVITVSIQKGIITISTRGVHGDIIERVVDEAYDGVSGEGLTVEVHPKYLLELIKASTFINFYKMDLPFCEGFNESLQVVLRID